MTRCAVVLGATSGIGEAVARRFVADDLDVVVCGRRTERLDALADELGVRSLRVDVTDPESVRRLGGLERCDVLVYSSGGAIGLDSVVDADTADWSRMYDTNVLGLQRVVRALHPQLRAGEASHIVGIGSIAGHEPYPGGGGYNAAKFGVRAVLTVLRQELHADGIRVTEIAPGATETEFSLVRFDGDEVRAAQVYEGYTPLTADDVAACVAFVAGLPAHVNVDAITLKPFAQIDARTVHRRS